MSYSDLLAATQQSIGSATSAAPQVRSAPSVSTVPPTVDAASSTVASQTDQSAFSYASGLLTQALSSANDRTVDIGALQKSILSGSYNVSASDLADKLIAALLS